MDSSSTSLDFSPLRKTLSGTLHEPGDATYTRLATPWNLAVPTSPAAVVAAATAQDVVVAVNFAVAHDLAVAVQATGHGISSNLDGALLVHTGALNECLISQSENGGTARIGAGTTWATVLSRCAEPGLTGLSGSAPGVSVAGYTSGGGIGPMVRTFGAASDRVRSLDVVTGDGELRHVTATTEPELFWGLRGGKGSLGIITSIEFELLALPTIYAGTLFFDTADVPKIMHAWAQWCPTLPPAATTSLALMQLPPMPGVPEPLAGRFTIAVRYVYIGNADDGATWLTPIRSAAVALMDTVGLMPSSRIGMVHSDPEDPLPAVEGSALLTDFTNATAQTLLETAGPDAHSSQLLVEIRQFGGALAQAPAEPSALCHRDAPFGLYTVGVGVPPDLAGIKSQSQLIRDHMTPWAYGGTLPNFSASSGQSGFAGSYTPEALERLSSLAQHFDPGNVFRVGQVPAR